MAKVTRHIAMWSGPRNISTAMMRSWGNRSDTAVCDEPFYAHYLLHTGMDHPGAAEVISHHETNWSKVVDWITGPAPGGKDLFYQKHMAHHLLPHMDRSWIEGMTHAFLIRDPKEMLISLAKHRPNPTWADTGLPQQIEILDWVRRRTGHTPPIIDARDVLLNPRDMLTKLCQALEVPFEDAMLSWPLGPRRTDGIWSKHWYAEVEKTTGFVPYRPRPEALPTALESLHAQCLPPYEALHTSRLTP